MKPIVSVIMPVCNMAGFVKEAIDSILQQSFTDFELIVVDDASVDGTDMIVRSYMDGRIVFERNDHNVGNYASRNKALQRANGKYVAIMDADDIAVADRLEKQVAYLEEHSDVLAVGSNCLFLPSGNLRKGPCSYLDIQLALLKNNCFVHSSLIIRIAPLLKLNGYNEHYYYSADYDLACRLVLLGKIENLVEPLIKYRCHPYQISILHGEKQQLFADEIRKKYQLNFINRYRGQEQSLINELDISVPDIGWAIAYYTYARYSGDIEQEQEADSLLDDIFSAQSEVVSVQQESVLFGIVYGVIYLLRNAFINGYEDEIFEEIDRQLLEKLTFCLKERNLDWQRWLYYLRLRLFCTRLPEREQYGLVFRKNLVFLLDCLIEEMEKGWSPTAEILFEISQLHEKKICFEKTAHILASCGID